MQTFLFYNYHHLFDRQFMRVQYFFNGCAYNSKTMNTKGESLSNIMSILLFFPRTSVFLTKLRHFSCDKMSLHLTLRRGGEPAFFSSWLNLLLLLIGSTSNYFVINSKFSLCVTKAFFTIDK